VGKRGRIGKETGEGSGKGKGSRVPPPIQSYFDHLISPQFWFSPFSNQTRLRNSDAVIACECEPLGSQRDEVWCVDHDHKLTNKVSDKRYRIRLGCSNNSFFHLYQRESLIDMHMQDRQTDVMSAKQKNCKHVYGNASLEDPGVYCWHSSVWHKTTLRHHAALCQNLAVVIAVLFSRPNI